MIVALHAATVGDRHAALVALLDAWRRVRHPRISALIELLGDELLAEAPPLPGRTSEQRRATFDQLASDKIDPVDFARYLALGWPAKPKAMAAHLERLSSWPADPRTVRALMRFLYEPNGQPKNVVRRAEILLADLADDHEAELADPDASALAAIETCFARSRERVTAARDEEAALLAAIYAEPDDRDLKAVYGDWLSQRNDPRGEFIALQLARGTQITSRETALIEEHTTGWAGAVGKWFDLAGRVFEDGFFAGGRLHNGAQEVLFAAIDATPAWRLVRTVRSQWNTDALVVASLAKLPSVRAVELAVHDGPASMELLETATPNLRDLTWRIPRYAAALDPRSLHGTCTSLPGLRAMTIAADRADQIVPWLAGAPVIDRLERLRVTAPEAGSILAAAVRRESLRELVLVPARGTWHLVLRRDTGATPFTSLVARFQPAPGNQKRWSFELREVLAMLPRDSLRALRVEGPKKKLAPEESAQLASLVAEFTHATIDVPWHAPTELAPPRLELLLDGPGILDAPDLRAQLATILAIHPFDAVARDDGDAVPLEGDPVGTTGVPSLIEAIVRASAGATRMILSRRGTFLHLVVARVAYYPRTVSGVLELGGPDPLDAFARLVAAGTFASASMRAPDAPRDAIYTSGFGSLLATIPRGWLVAFANRDVLARVTLDEVLAGLPDGMRAIERGGYLVVATAPTPAGATDARTFALGNYLVGLLARTFAARFYDFRERTAAAVTPLGFAPLDGNEPTRALFRLDGRTVCFELEDPFDNPRMSARVWGDLDDTLVDFAFVPTAADLDRELAAIVATLSATPA